MKIKVVQSQGAQLFQNAQETHFGYILYTCYIQSKHQTPTGDRASINRCQLQFSGVKDPSLANKPIVVDFAFRNGHDKMYTLEQAVYFVQAPLNMFVQISDQKCLLLILY